MKLKDKSIIITGSSSGIGQAIAVAAAQEGMFVVVHYRNNSEGAQQTLAEVEKYSSGLIVQADLIKIEEVRGLFKNLSDSGIQLDALVNNAGQFKSGSFDNYDVWIHQWENIFLPALSVTNEFIAQPHQEGVRKIVIVGSVYGLPNTSDSGCPHYSAMKSALHSLTESMAKAFSPQILVNAVAPGYTLTRVWEGVDTDLYGKRNRISRMVEPEEIAQMVISLIQNDAMTGEIIRIDGGLHLQETG